MTIKTALFCAILIIGTSLMNAQKDLECKTKLSLFHEAVKAKKYDAAYEDWSFVRTNCPDLNIAIYSDGEKILKHKIKNTKGNKKLEILEDLIVLWKTRSQYFSKKTRNGEYAAKACQIKYDNNELFGESKEELYNCFNDAFKADSKTFTHPKSLYSYFSLMVDLFDKDKKTNAELFNAYDDITEKIQDEIQNYSEKLNPLLDKQEKEELLTEKEKKNKSVYESYLKNYALIQTNIDAKLSVRAVCDNLIPLYTKDFETYKNNAVWLKRAVSRMYHKECTEDPLYEKLVRQYVAISPSADTNVYMATILIKKNKTSEAFKYLEEAYQLETDTYKKSKLANRIGIILKDKRLYTRARNYFNNALKLNPSNGKPHLLTADMYNDSAKNCGKDNFYKRAVYWLAAKEAKKASRKDPTLQKLVKQNVANYEAKAPTRKEIFERIMAGKRIDIGCWIKSYVIVPKL
jgi:hypothetical protein